MLESLKISGEEFELTRSPASSFDFPILLELLITEKL